MIELKLQLAPKSEERLRKYAKKQFNKTLEAVLTDVLKQWIGRAIEHAPGKS